MIPQSPESDAQDSACCGSQCGCNDPNATREAPSELDSLKSQFADLSERYRRTLADFQNYQKRSLLNEQRARTMAIADVARSLILPLDHLELALQQSEPQADNPQAGTIRAGVQLVVDEFLKALAAHGVHRIEVRPGEEFTPGRHEAVTQIPAGNITPGRIAQCFQSGYLAGEFVLRPAKVAIAAS